MPKFIRLTLSVIVATLGMEYLFNMYTAPLYIHFIIMSLFILEDMILGSYWGVCSYGMKVER